MKKIFLLSIIALNFQMVFSQDLPKQNDNMNQMEKSNYLGLRTTIYMVADLNQAKEWYSKAFETKPYFDEPYYVGFNIGGYELGLLPEEKPSGEKTKNVIAYWGVNEIDKMYNHLINIGAQENEKPFSVGGDLITASVIDPWGNAIGLIYNPEFKLGK